MSVSLTRFRPILLSVLFFAVAVGQLVRLEVFPGTSIGLTVVDAASVVATLGLLIWGGVTRQLALWARAVWGEKVWRWAFIFILFALLTLAIQAWRYPIKEVVIAFSYWGRLGVIFVLAALLRFSGLLSSKPVVIKHFLFWSGVLLLIGYVQLIFVGNFAFMARFGWDPHVGRMLSSFFDPNFFGVFLVLLMSVITGLLFRGPKRGWLIFFFFIAWIGLYLTYSRSAWITGAIAVPLAFWPRSWKLGLVVLALFVALAFLPGRLGSRFQFGTTIFSKGVLSSQLKGKKSSVDEVANQGADASGAARLLSFRKGWQLVKTNPITGVGYNAYGYALVNAGLATPDSLGTRSGYFSDSSLLNILVTTGVIGLGLYLTFYYLVLKQLLKSWRRAELLGTALFGFTIAWILGSFFNNTLLYVFILLPWFILWGAHDSEAL